MICFSTLKGFIHKGMWQFCYSTFANIQSYYDIEYWTVPMCRNWELTNKLLFTSSEALYQLNWKVLLNYVCFSLWHWKKWALWSLIPTQLPCTVIWIFTLRTMNLRFYIQCAIILWESFAFTPQGYSPLCEWAVDLWSCTQCALIQWEIFCHMDTL